MTTTNARPYAWPFHGTFDPSMTALLVTVDDAAVSLPPQLQALATASEAAGIFIVGLPAQGLSMPPAIPRPAVFERAGLDGFWATPLDRELRRRGVTDLVITGLPLELGADCTMRSANDLGYECLLVEDASTCLDPQTFAGAVATTQMSGGIFGTVGLTADILRLLTTATAPGENS